MKTTDFITFLGTENLETTTEFYNKILQLKLYKDQGVCKIFKITKTCKIGFCTHMPLIPSERSAILTFVVDDVDQWYIYFKTNLDEYIEKPKLNPKFNIYHFFIKDPNGYLLEFQRFLD